MSLLNRHPVGSKIVSLLPMQPLSLPLHCIGGHKGQTGEHEEEEGNINEWPTNFSAAAITFDTLSRRARKLESLHYSD